MAILCKLINHRTRELIPPLLELPDDSAAALAAIVNPDNYTLDPLPHGARYTLEPLQETPAVARLRELHRLSTGLAKGCDRLYKFMQFSDGVLNQVDKLFEPYEVIVITDLRQDLTALFAKYAGENRGYQPVEAQRQPLGDLVGFLQEEPEPELTKLKGYSVDQQ